MWAQAQIISQLTLLMDLLWVLCTIISSFFFVPVSVAVEERFYWFASTVREGKQLDRCCSSPLRWWTGPAWNDQSISSCLQATSSYDQLQPFPTLTVSHWVTWSNQTRLHCFKVERRGSDCPSMAPTVVSSKLLMFRSMYVLSILLKNLFSDA